MARNPKLYIHGKSYFLTSRVLEGLPFVPSYFIHLTTESIIARAQELYDIKISAFVVMGNHVHFLIVVQNPSHVDAFMRYFKTETAHAINKMIGKSKGPLWEERYDSPIVLDAAKLKKQIAYIYTNPQKANLVETIEEYPGLSSWSSLVHGVTEYKTLRISRKAYSKLPRYMSERQKRKFAAKLKDSSEGRSNSYTIDLKAAYDSVETEQSFEDFKTDIIDLVRENELELEEKRAEEGKSVLGAAALRGQSMYKEHRPKAWGKKMICLASDIETRKRFIYFFKALRNMCLQAYEKIVRGCKKTIFPPGFYMPGGVKFAEMLPDSYF